MTHLANILFLVDFIKGLQSGRQDCTHFHCNVRIMKVHSQNVGCCAVVPRSRRTHYVTWTSCVSGFPGSAAAAAYKIFCDVFFQRLKTFTLSPLLVLSFLQINTPRLSHSLCTNINCASLLEFNLLLTGYPTYLYTIFIGRWDCF